MTAPIKNLLYVILNVEKNASKIAGARISRLQFTGLSNPKVQMIESKADYTQERNCLNVSKKRLRTQSRKL